LLKKKHQNSIETTKKKIASCVGKQTQMK